MVSTAALPRVANAHPNSLSAPRVLFERNATRITLNLPKLDLDKWFPPDRFPAESYVDTVGAELAKDDAALFEVLFDERPVRATWVQGGAGLPGFVHVELRYPPVDRASLVIVRSTHLPRLHDDHQQVIAFLDARDGDTPRFLGEHTLTRDANACAVILEPIGDPKGSPATVPSTVPAQQRASTTAPATLPSPAPPSVAMAGASSGETLWFALGVEHILTGYDHLLFLAALLLVADRFADAAKVITLFTLAHSITLALAALDLVRLSGHLVEPAIAASIVYVAVENVWARRRTAWRWLVVFVFGLIHGLGFASVLRELGLGEDGRGVVGPLVRFNLGVEAGQLAVAGVLFPLLLILKWRPALAARVVPAASIAIAMMGAWWFVQRIA